MISVVIPSYHEDCNTIYSCLSSIKEAKKNCPCEVEIFVAKDIKGIGKARNFGATQTKGDILVFIDADCTMSSNFLHEVYEKSLIEENVGGGTKWVKFDKYSLGRILCLIPTAIWLYWNQVTFGAFWIRREYFNLLKGFVEDEDILMDYIFVTSLKKLAKSHKRSFRSIKRSYITWSTRGWDKYGEWFWLKKYHIFKEETI